jgi:hypothetical protein
MKKETLEEAAENNSKKVGSYAGYQDFIAGAKWQAKRMYSKEELLQALNIGFTSTDETWVECVAFAKEQFKNK